MQSGGTWSSMTTKMLQCTLVFTYFLNQVADLVQRYCNDYVTKTDFNWPCNMPNEPISGMHLPSLVSSDTDKYVLLNSTDVATPIDLSTLVMLMIVIWINMLRIQMTRATLPKLFVMIKWILNESVYAYFWVLCIKSSSYWCVNAFTHPYITQKQLK